MNGAEWRTVGNIQYACGNYHTAIAAFLRARDGGEDSPDFNREFAITLWAAGDRDAAMAEIYKAKDAPNAAVQVKIANFLAALGDYSGAAKWLSKAIELDPHPQAKFERALFLLTTGDWERGWQEYEARLDVNPLDFPDNGIPLWKGENLRGKTIWITYEQGMGDQIMFCRYVPWVKSLGANVIYDSHAELADFSFAADIPTRTMGSAGHYKVPLHPATGKKPDYRCALMSLPARHKTTLDNVPPIAWFRPAAYPYTAKIRGAEGKKKIGLCWAGNKNHPGDQVRSMPLTSLMPLTGNGKCEFYSFQANERGDDVAKFGADLLINRLPLRMWMQTAAALKQMDALVTVDTSVAHMAGSLGVKTFLMLSTEPDFRWTDKGETTPWYPSMKLIRQTSRGDWAGVVRRAADEICAI